MKKCIQESLAPALRQYKHNNGSPGFVIGFDFEETIKIVENLLVRKSLTPGCYKGLLFGHEVTFNIGSDIYSAVFATEISGINIPTSIIIDDEGGAFCGLLEGYAHSVTKINN